MSKEWIESLAGTGENLPHEIRRLDELGLLVPPRQVRQALARNPDGLPLPDLPRWTDEALRTPASQNLDRLSEAEFNFCLDAMDASSEAATQSLIGRKQASWKYQPGVEELCAKYPDIPTLRQLLMNFLNLAGPASKAETHAHQLLEAYPDYLFARANLVEMACSAKDWQRAEDLLKGSYEISDHDPQGKRLFHESEIRAFYGPVCSLHLGRKRYLRALWAFALILAASPGYPISIALATKLLKLPKAELKALAAQLEPPRRLGKLGKGRHRP
ncbi:MAG: hypothetical protein ACAI44_04125 [Candidatus Sericytochromatia bacterium]